MFNLSSKIFDRYIRDIWKHCHVRFRSNICCYRYRLNRCWYQLHYLYRLHRVGRILYSVYPGGFLFLAVAKNVGTFTVTLSVIVFTLKFITIYIEIFAKAVNIIINPSAFLDIAVCKRINTFSIFSSVFEFTYWLKKNFL